MKEQTKAIIAILIFILMMGGIVLMIMTGVEESKQTIERCKAKGWDGAKFKSRFTNEMICSNFSQAEKDAMERGGEK